jgi:hypothetical protein
MMTMIGSATAAPGVSTAMSAAIRSVRTLLSNASGRTTLRMSVPSRSPDTTSELVEAAGWPHQVTIAEGEFTEGRELDRKWKVPKTMIGRRLSQAEAKRLLAKLE